MLDSGKSPQGSSDESLLVKIMTTWDSNEDMRDVSMNVCVHHISTLGLIAEKRLTSGKTRKTEGENCRRLGTQRSWLTLATEWSREKQNSKADGDKRWETRCPGNGCRRLPCDYPVNVLPTKL